MSAGNSLLLVRRVRARIEESTRIRPCDQCANYPTEGPGCDDAGSGRSRIRGARRRVTIRAAWGTRSATAGCVGRNKYVTSERWYACVSRRCCIDWRLSS